LGRTPVIQNGCLSSHHIVKPENRVLWKDLPSLPRSGRFVAKNIGIKTTQRIPGQHPLWRAYLILFSLHTHQHVLHASHRLSSSMRSSS